MAVPSTTSRSATYYHTRIGRSELDRLFAVASEGATAGTVSVQTRVGNAQLEAETIADLIANRAALPYVSDRTPWLDLVYERNEQPGKRIQLRLTGDDVSVTVSSTDPIWAHGQIARLEEILQACHGRVWKLVFSQSAGPKAIGSAILGVAIAAVMIWANRENGTEPDLQGMVMMVATFSYAFVTAIIGWWKVRTARPVLRVESEVESGSEWSLLSAGDQIAFASSAIAALSLVVAVVALF